MATMLLIDGPALAYRSHFGLARSNLTTATGESTAATYGFVTALLKLLGDHEPMYAAVAFDTAKPTYRHELLKEYKAGRPGMPEELARQQPWIKEASLALGVRPLELDGYEADDVIATLARIAARGGADTLIVTGDKDMLQLVDARTKVLMFSSSSRDVKVFDETAVAAKYGMGPALLPDLFALMGDKIDNVAGVPGIGEKTATDLVTRYGSLEAIYEHLDDVSAAKAHKALAENRDKAFSSRELVRVHTEVPLNVKLEDLSIGAIDGPAVRGLFSKLNFRRLMRQVIHDDSEPKSAPLVWSGGLAGKAPAELLPGQPGLWEHAASGGQAREEQASESSASVAGREGGIDCRGALALEIAGEPGPAGRGAIMGLGLACEGGDDHYFPLGHVEPGSLTSHELRALIGGLVESADTPKIVHDAKKAMLALRRVGMNLQGVEFDALLARYLLNPGHSAQSVRDLALDYLGSFEACDNEGMPKGETVALKEAAEKTARRARILLDLREPMEQDLRAKGLWELFRDLELPLAEVLADMEARGVRTNAGLLETLSEDLESRLAMLEKEALALAGRSFNLSSPREISQVLFDDLGLKPRRKTKTGYSTDLSVLIELSTEHDLPRKILEHRQIAKLKSTYVDQLLRFRDPETGRIHASFNQTVTATGRLSSSDPNLQNVPIRGEFGAEIRKAFVPGAEGWTMIAGDYSQVELRVAAHLSRDENLLEAFRRGEDIHAQTAASVFKVTPANVSSEMRGTAKVVNFGIIYGMGATALAKTTGLALEAANKFLEEHRGTYPRLYAYLDEVVRGARENGYVETILGRKRFLPTISSSEPAVRSAAERAAINTPIQGSAADLIKLAMLGVHRRVKEERLQGGILIQVHDEILVDCPDSERDRMEAILYNEMTNAYSLAVPLKVDIKCGRNWYEAH
jgi:DNA polymerase-1